MFTEPIWVIFEKSYCEKEQNENLIIGSLDINKIYFYFWRASEILELDKYIKNVKMRDAYGGDFECMAFKVHR